MAYALVTHAIRDNTVTVIWLMVIIYGLIKNVHIRNLKEQVLKSAFLKKSY